MVNNYSTKTRHKLNRANPKCCRSMSGFKGLRCSVSPALLLLLLGCAGSTPCMQLSSVCVPWLWCLQYLVVPSATQALLPQLDAVVLQGLYISGFYGSLKLWSLIPWLLHSSVLYNSKASTTWKILASLAASLGWILALLNHVCSTHPPSFLPSFSFLSLPTPFSFIFWDRFLCVVLEPALELAL